MLINVKMPTIVGILTFMSRINFALNWVEHGMSLGPVLLGKADKTLKMENAVRASRQNFIN